MHKYPSWVLKEMNEEIDDVIITDSNADLLMSVTPRASIASRGKWIFSRIDIFFEMKNDINTHLQFVPYLVVRVKWLQVEELLVSEKVRRASQLSHVRRSSQMSTGTPSSPPKESRL